jgi:hypothetical protein
VKTGDSVKPRVSARDEKQKFVKAIEDSDSLCFSAVALFKGLNDFDPARPRVDTRGFMLPPASRVKANSCVFKDCKNLLT